MADDNPLLANLKFHVPNEMAQALNSAFERGAHTGLKNSQGTSVQELQSTDEKTRVRLDVANNFNEQNEGSRLSFNADPKKLVTFKGRF